MPSIFSVSARFATPVTEMLAAYPHVSRCAYCCAYAADALLDYPQAGSLVLSAVLGHHESFHRSDPLVIASEHFAIDDRSSLV